MRKQCHYCKNSENCLERDNSYSGLNKCTLYYKHKECLDDKLPKEIHNHGPSEPWLRRKQPGNKKPLKRKTKRKSTR
jgi:hypothetical protein